MSPGAAVQRDANPGGQTKALTKPDDTVEQAEARLRPEPMPGGGDPTAGNADDGFAELLAKVVAKPAALDDAFLKALAEHRSTLTPAQLTQLVTVCQGVGVDQKLALFTALGVPVDAASNDYSLKLGPEADPKGSTLTTSREKGRIDFSDVAGKTPGEESADEGPIQYEPYKSIKLRDRFTAAELDLMFAEAVKLPASHREARDAFKEIQPASGRSGSSFEDYAGKGTDRVKVDRVNLGGLERSEGVAGDRWDAARNQRLTAEGKDPAKTKLTDDEKKTRAEQIKTEGARLYSKSMRHEIGHGLDFRDHPSTSWHGESGWTEFSDGGAFVDKIGGLVSDVPAPTDAATKAAFEARAKKIASDLVGAGGSSTGGKIAAALTAAEGEAALGKPFVAWFNGSVIGKVLNQGTEQLAFQKRYKWNGGYAALIPMFKSFQVANSTLTASLDSWNNPPAAFSIREWAAECYQAWFDVAKPGDPVATNNPIARQLPSKAQEWLKGLSPPGAVPEDVKNAGNTGGGGAKTKSK